MKNVAQLIAKEQKELIIKALEVYRHTLSITMDRHDAMGNTINGSIEYDVFDLTGLIGMMKYDVEVRLPKKHKDTFASNHGVDFPEYIGEVDNNYPIEVDEWVTVVTGDFSFIDDNVHARECRVNNIVSIEKHLRSQVNDYIDDIEADGLGYIVIEDYDGSIEFDVNEVKDEREFLVVDAPNNTSCKQSYSEMEETDGDIMNVFDELEVGEVHIRREGEIYYFRIK